MDLNEKMPYESEVYYDRRKGIKFSKYLDEGYPGCVIDLENPQERYRVSRLEFRSMTLTSRSTSGVMALIRRKMPELYSSLKRRKIKGGEIHTGLLKVLIDDLSIAASYANYD